MLKRSFKSFFSVIGIIILLIISISSPNNLPKITTTDSLPINPSDITYIGKFGLGTYGNAPGQFANETDVAVGGSQIYVSDQGNNRIPCGKRS